MKSKISTLKQKIASGSSDAYEYLMEITADARTDDDKKQLAGLASELLSGAKHAITDLEHKVEKYTVKQQLGDLADVINFSYIARRYFGKSKHWLYQRINGYEINGKKVEFTPSEREKFNNALNDVRAKIGVFTADTI